jgi:hypothetical protein
MTNQIPNDLAESSRLQNLMVQLSTESSTELLEDLMVLGDRPEVLSLLMYKLAEERSKTNKLLEDLNKKYDALVEKLGSPHTPNEIKPIFYFSRPSNNRFGDRKRTCFCRRS